MAVLMHVTMPEVSTSQYDDLNSDLQAQGEALFDGLIAHVCLPAGAGVEIVDVWESEEAMQHFFEAMMPIAEKHGLPESPEQPKVTEVHNHWIPGKS
jgi:hypothetical protein